MHINENHVNREIGIGNARNFFAYVGAKINFLGLFLYVTKKIHRRK